MNNRTHFPLILGWLLIPYGIAYFFSVYKINLGNLAKYTGVFRQWTLLVGLLLFLVCIWASQYQSPRREVIHATRLSLWIVWLFGFLLPLGIAFGLFVYINPHARFTSNHFPFVITGARLIKTELYKNLDIAPEIVVMGSSRAFTLSPEYIEKQTGYKTFNMSVEGARGGDYSMQLKFMQNHMPPHVLIVEFSRESLPRNKASYFNIDLQSVSLIPYMPLDSAALFLEIVLRDSLGLQALSDSAFILTLPDAHNQLETWRFGVNGLGIAKPFNLVTYNRLLKSDIKERSQGFYCRNIPGEIPRQAFDEFLKSALEKNIGIVLYESPMNGALYDAAYQSSPDRFELCRQITSDYLKSLTPKYPNIFFRDLSGYEKINDLQENGFYDAIHLRPIASEMVIDLLLPDIKSAMAWALERQGQISP